MYPDFNLRKIKLLSHHLNTKDYCGKQRLSRKVLFIKATDCIYETKVLKNCFVAHKNYINLTYQN